MNCKLDLELVESVADKDLDVLTSMIHEDVCSLLFAGILLHFLCEVMYVLQYYSVVYCGNGVVVLVST